MLTGRRALCLLIALALAGCGGPRPSVGSCLNAKGFLVEQESNVVRGSSRRGVNFTLTVYRGASAARRAFDAVGRTGAALLGDAVVDFAGNPPASPGGAPAKLSAGELGAISACLAHT